MKIFSSIIAAIGKQLKQSVKVFQSLMLYRRLPVTSRHVQSTLGVGKVSIPTFVIETIYPVDTRTFMIATQDEEIFRVFDLVGEKKTDSLEGLFSSIYIVAKEKVVCFWWKPAIFKKSKEVVILTVYVPLKNDDEYQISGTKARKVKTDRIS